MVDINIHVFLKHGIITMGGKIIGVVYLGPLTKTLTKRVVYTVEDKHWYTVPFPTPLNPIWSKYTQASMLGVFYLDPDPKAMDVVNSVAKVVIHDFSPSSRRYPSIVRLLNFKYYPKTMASKLQELNDLITWDGIKVRDEPVILADIIDSIIRRREGSESIREGAEDVNEQG